MRSEREVTDTASRVYDAIGEGGWRLVQQHQSVNDPHCWWIIARRGDYELRFQIRHVAIDQVSE